MSLREIRTPCSWQLKTRRDWLRRVAGGMGAVGLNAMLAQNAGAAPISHYTGTRRPVKAKHVIFLFMAGGPSHIDLFDPKPVLFKAAGQRPDSVNLRTERET